jgi:rSAM/selenodomain-associated transferase 1
MTISLGVMARAPTPGRCKTRLAQALGAEGAARLYAAMLADSLAAFARIGVSRLVVMAAPEDDGVATLRALAPKAWEVIAQEGEGLGARLAHAMKKLGEGADAVALVDSDSPTVPTDPIARALERLHGQKRALVGPCDDGGYYLVATTGIELGILRDIPWSTPGVMRATRTRCNELGLALEELPTWYDVDDTRDLERLRRELAEHPERAPRTAAVLEVLR